MARDNLSCPESPTLEAILKGANLDLSQLATNPLGLAYSLLHSISPGVGSILRIKFPLPVGMTFVTSPPSLSRDCWCVSRTRRSLSAHLPWRSQCSYFCSSICELLPSILYVRLWRFSTAAGRSNRYGTGMRWSKLGCFFSIRPTRHVYF